MTASVCLDSNILIDYLNKSEAARAVILAYPDATVSAVVWMEVLATEMNAAREAAARTLLSCFRKIEITPAIQERALRIRKANRPRLKLPDAIIYATAEEQGSVLLTCNDKDFPPGDMRVHVPYQL